MFQFTDMLLYVGIVGETKSLTQHQNLYIAPWPPDWAPLYWIMFNGFGTKVNKIKNLGHSSITNVNQCH